MTPSDPPSAAGGHPQIGMQHKNGDRMFGIAGLVARTLAERGTPKASSLYRSTVTEHVRAVRVGDELRVAWDGTYWWASSAAGVVGRLTWSKGLRRETSYAPGEGSPYDFDAGVLRVQSVTVDTSGAVVDCGGYVVPDGLTTTPDVASADVPSVVTCDVKCRGPRVAAAVAAIVRATNGNFRLADRLVTQINRILDINKHTRVTPEAVDAAQEAFLIGR